MGFSNSASLVGIRPIDDMDDGVHAIARQFIIPATSAVDLYVGDQVKAVLAGGGAPTPAPSGGVAPASDPQISVSGQYQNVIIKLAADVSDVLGVVVGFLYDPERNKAGLKYIPAGVAAQIALITDPTQIFRVCVSGVLTMANVGQNIDVTARAPNQAFGWPGTMLDAATVANTTTLPWRLLRPSLLPGNDITLTNAFWDVRMNTSERFSKAKN